MSNEQPHSGSRWEPTASTASTGETATDRIATPAAHPAPGLGVFPAVPVGASPKPRNRRRAGVLAAVAAGLLALGGVGGYAIGRTADGPPTGLAGATGEYGHHRGPSDADGGLRGDRDGDGAVGDGSVGDGSAGTGTGSTGTST